MSSDQPYGKNQWILTGLMWGFFMYLIMEIAYPYIIGEPYTTKKMITGGLLWGIGGLVYGFVMNKFFSSRNQKN